MESNKVFKPEKSYEIEIVQSEDGNGFSIFFDERPEETIASILFMAGFKSKIGDLEFYGDNQRLLTFADDLKKALYFGKLPKIVPYQSQYETNLENLELRKFTIITFIFNKNERNNSIEQLLIFETTKKKINAIAKLFLMLKNSPQKSTFITFTGSKIEQARTLFHSKKYLHSLPFHFVKQSTLSKDQQTSQLEDRKDKTPSENEIHFSESKNDVRKIEKTFENYSNDARTNEINDRKDKTPSENEIHFSESKNDARKMKKTLESHSNDSWTNEINDRKDKTPSENENHFSESKNDVRKMEKTFESRSNDARTNEINDDKHNSLNSSRKPLAANQIGEYQIPKNFESQIPIESIKITGYSNSRNPDWDQGQMVNSWKKANQMIASMVGEFSNAYYQLIWKDGEEYYGIFDLEPSDDFKGKPHLLSKHCDYFFWAAINDPDSFLDQESIDRLRNLYKNYALFDKEDQEIELNSGVVNINPEHSTETNTDLEQERKKVVSDPAKENELSQSKKSEKSEDANSSKSQKQTKKGLNKRARINYEIEDLIDERIESKKGFNPEEIELLKQYSGWGGVVKDQKDSGMLYEYYTDKKLVKEMWKAAYHYGYNGGDVLEPSAGIGHFLKYTDPNNRVVGFETSKYSAFIAQLLYPHAEIYNEPFEAMFFQGNRHLKENFRLEPFDLVIGNPPYGKFSGKYAGMGEKGFTKAKEYDHYFITRGLDVLKSGGLLIMLVSAGFTQSANAYQKVKEEIASKAIILRELNLPNGIFKHTDVGTTIIVLKKRML